MNMIDKLYKELDEVKEELEFLQNTIYENTLYRIYETIENEHVQISENVSVLETFKKAKEPTNIDKYHKVLYALAKKKFDVEVNSFGELKSKLTGKQMSELLKGVEYEYQSPSEKKGIYKESLDETFINEPEVNEKLQALRERTSDNMENYTFRSIVRNQMLHENIVDIHELSEKEEIRFHKIVLGKLK